MHFGSGLGARYGRSPAGATTDDGLNGQREPERCSVLGTPDDVAAAVSRVIQATGGRGLILPRHPSTKLRAIVEDARVASPSSGAQP